MWVRELTLDLVSLKKIGVFIFHAVSLLRRRVGEQVVKQTVDDLNLDNSTGPLSTEIRGPPTTSPNITLVSVSTKEGGLGWLREANEKSNKPAIMRE